MKKLLTLFVVLTAFAAGAQTITEKDLLGRWNFIAMGSGGNYIDFETNAVTTQDGMELSDEEREEIFGKGGLKEEITQAT